MAGTEATTFGAVNFMGPEEASGAEHLGYANLTCLLRELQENERILVLLEGCGQRFQVFRNSASLERQLSPLRNVKMRPHQSGLPATRGAVQNHTAQRALTRQFHPPHSEAAEQDLHFWAVKGNLLKPGWGPTGFEICGEGKDDAASPKAKSKSQHLFKQDN